MNYKSPLALIAIPAAFVAINLIYLSVLFPVYSASPGFDQDPAYAYLFNGLLLIDGQGPWQVDHPGTPLQLLTAAVILFARGLFFIAGHSLSPDIVDDALANPEPYLYVVSCVLMLLNAGALYYLGLRVRRATDSFMLACLCQASGLAFAMVTPKAAYVSPEALLIFATLCLLGQLAPLAFAAGGTSAAKGNDADHGHCSERWTGVICGLGLAAKVTFLPLFGLALLIRPARKLLTCAGYAVVTLLVLLSPTIKNQERFFNWIWGIASHSGRHGTGESRVIPVSDLIQNFGILLKWFPAFYAVMGALLGYLLVATLRDSAGRNTSHAAPSLRFPLVVLLAVLVQTLLVLKHPGAHYMVPILPLAFAGLAWLLFRVDFDLRQCDPSFGLRWRHLTLGIALVFGLYSVAPTIRQIDRIREQRAAQNSALAVIDREMQRYPDALVICAFRCTMPKYATAFGLIYAPGLSTRPIVRDLLVNFYEYNFFVREFIAPGFKTQTLDALSDEIARGRKIFLVTPRDYPDLAVFDLKKVVATPELTLYEVIGIRSGNAG